MRGPARDTAEPVFGFKDKAAPASGTRSSVGERGASPCVGRGEHRPGAGCQRGDCGAGRADLAAALAAAPEAGRPTAAVTGTASAECEDNVMPREPRPINESLLLRLPAE